jgi:hypothetical protein
VLQSNYLSRRNALAYCAVASMTKKNVFGIFTCGHCYKTFYICNLQMDQISCSVCPWQSFQSYALCLQVRPEPLKRGLPRTNTPAYSGQLYFTKKNVLWHCHLADGLPHDVQVFKLKWRINFQNEFITVRESASPGKLNLTGQHIFITNLLYRTPLKCCTNGTIHVYVIKSLVIESTS